MSKNLPRPGPSRRRFLEQTGTVLAGMALPLPRGERWPGLTRTRKLRVAAVVTEFTYRSHAACPPRELPRALSVQRARRRNRAWRSSASTSTSSPKGTWRARWPRTYGITIYPTIAEALARGRASWPSMPCCRSASTGRYPTNAKGADRVPAQAILRRDRRRVPPERGDGAGVQRQAPVVPGRLGRGDGRDGPEDGLPAHGGQLGPAGGSAGRRWNCPRARRSRRRCRSTAEAWRPTTSTGWRCSSRWSNRGRRRDGDQVRRVPGRRRTVEGRRRGPMVARRWPTPRERPTPTGPEPGTLTRGGQVRSGSSRRSTAFSSPTRTGCGVRC